MPDGASPAPTVELRLLSTAAAPSPEAEHHGFLEVPSARRGHRRSSLARLTELEHQLHRDKGHLAEKKLAKALALVLYTLARISANLVSIDYENHIRIVNALARPLVTGLGVGMFLIREERFSTKSRLLIWSRRTVFVLAIFVFDESMSTLRAALPILSVLPWEITCNVMQVHMTNLRLQALGWRLTAKFCHIMAAIGCSFLLGGLVILTSRISISEFGKEGNLTVERVGAPASFLLFFSFFCCWTTLFTQCGALCQAGSKAMVAGRADLDLDLKLTACFLYLNALLVLLGPALGFWSWAQFVRRIEMTWLTIDICVQIFTALALSGMMGPRNPMDAFRKLADLSGYGFASKRITFPGHINERAAKCIVSFPGVYNKLWDKAVKAVRDDFVTEEDLCSLACVFLTDSASGLGQHSMNPDTPGKCWCHAIYGQIRASAYLRVVEVDPCEADSIESREKLRHEVADADAMNQVLLIKSEQNDLEWQKQYARALRTARDLGQENGGRAPWGCQWFEVWKKNVDRAVELKQELHVFYFQGRKGQGKLSWEDLSSDAAKNRVRPESGLGASQTAEVAYLLKMGIPFKEHDVQDFLSFLSSESS
ncbi:Kif11 [Symbiodinium necroappetens]|uniref:Kif11 protein n=1 Tax=Symbiodinium necroappetens TaxID=1628268 RepID=A0A812J4H2_9DINO|nr:Kif11 [Symbiodinium necroappetens]